MGDIDLQEGGNTLPIGGRCVEFKAVRNISLLKVASGKSAESSVLMMPGDIELD